MKKIPYFIFFLFLITLFLFFFLSDYRVYEDSDFGITTYHSKVDYDQDGIDDQKDILNSVRTYLKTNPKYKSKYYETGYPNDGYGVCTDVVAFGLKGAGYDLQELVYQDILAHREDYDIETIDKNIDFRRVKNLKVFFKRHAISLTTDVKDYEEWQGGDIVIFEKHIGIVSNYRNRKKIPYFIHHANPYQFSYEENILGSRKDIIGHYRVS